MTQLLNRSLAEGYLKLGVASHEAVYNNGQVKSARVGKTKTLQGKVALITGASRGIGRAIALKLAKSGCDVAANYYNSHDEAESLCEAVRSMGRRAVAIQANVASPESVDELLEELRREFPRIDILISNAASGVLKPALEMTVKHWRWCMETNALALNLIVQRAIAMMAGDASVIALSSLGSQRAMPDYGFIGASKAALESIVRTLAYELGPRGIRVNAVSAGLVETDALEFFPNRAEMIGRFANRSPSGRVLTPEDVANAVYLLCLPEARMINGQTIVVDGGYSIAE
jgi:enoyl-[acyl-carrier protein] reductase III